MMLIWGYSPSNYPPENASLAADLQADELFCRRTGKVADMEAHLAIRVRWHYARHVWLIIEPNITPSHTW